MAPSGSELTVNLNGAAIMKIVNDLAVEFPLESVTRSMNCHESINAGVPWMTPAAPSKTRSRGNCPDEPHVYGGVPPEAIRLCVYVPPTAPVVSVGDIRNG